ncbi:GNAT family N-acetyltransferase [candidate division TA06 bacterium]|uniref:GNAT family N-acetyltransferase n=1 Tax=candidate division TA06 bacterium TaxID=2250710 RepID=A0A933IFK6_UNCT6|nr:GNAT family N-acetyltransferase [candidate division TA06 bacterium]
MKIRKLITTDYPELIRLWERAKLPAKPKGRDSRKHIAKEMACNPGFFIGAFDRNLLIGSVIASHDGRKGWLNRIAVDPDYRRLGLAQKLTLAGEKALRKQGIKIFGLLIHEYNTASLKLAKKMGYKVHGDILYLTKRNEEHI